MFLVECKENMGELYRRDVVSLLCSLNKLEFQV